MMETFLVLGLCFILYEALDFFQGCIHSATPSASDQIDAYRRQLDKERQKQQEEQFLANLTPLLSAQLAAAGFTLSTSTTPTASTASVISDHLKVSVHKESEQSSTSIPDLSSSTQSLRPQYTIHDTALLHATSSLPRDYYYLQQQQLKNKSSSRPLLSKFASITDNRIYPEYASVVPSLPGGVIIAQPKSIGNESNSIYQDTVTIDNTPPTTDDLLKNNIINNQNPNNNNQNSNSNNNNKRLHQNTCNCHILLTHRNDTTTNKKSYSTTDSAASFNSEESMQSSDTEPPNSTSLVTDSPASSSSAVSSVSYISQTQSAEHDFAAEQQRSYTLAGSFSSSHQDFREIECERLRRQCVSIKRIYSISEKF